MLGTLNYDYCNSYTEHKYTVGVCRIYLQSASQICRTVALEKNVLYIDYVFYLCVLYDSRNEQDIFSPKPQYVTDLIGRGIQSITQQVLLTMFNRG